MAEEVMPLRKEKVAAGCNAKLRKSGQIFVHGSREVRNPVYLAREPVPVRRVHTSL